MDKASARPGDSLTYTLTYTNQGADPLREIAISDTTPAYTRFETAATGDLPAGLSGVTVTAPAVGGTGALRWSFSGDLPPGATGNVSYTVRVEP